MASTGNSLANPIVIPTVFASKYGGTRAGILFVVILAAYVAQSQLTQHIQTNLGYRQPYFLFYIAHSTFIVIFPLHLLYLTQTTGVPGTRYISGLMAAISQHISASPSRTFPTLQLVKLVAGLTFGVTTTAVLWYVSVAFAPVSDVTALFNTNAFWAYLFSVVLAGGPFSRRQWEIQKLLAVLGACLGVFAVVYGGAQPTSKPSQANDPRSPKTTSRSASATIFGDALALASSISYALYQVLYKRYAVLSPEDDPHQAPSPAPPPIDSAYQPLLTSDPEFPVSSEAPGDSLVPPVSLPSISSSIKPPFAFHPNFLTSLIGLTTLVFLWIPIPILHVAGYPFAFPPDVRTWGYIGLVAATGVVFNGGFMVLLGIWGPVIVSVGNLLTIVLVLASDAIFGNGAETITMWSLIGCGMIVGAFAVIAANMIRSREP